MPQPPSPVHNKLLAALPLSEYRQLVPHLDLVEWRVGTTICNGGGPPPFLYFPATGIAGLIRPAPECRFTEVAVTGNDGAVGLDLLLAGDAALCRVDVLGAGFAYRLGADTLAREFSIASMLQQLIIQYTQSMITQIALTASCNRRHALEERICRWLLICAHRGASLELWTNPGIIARSMEATPEEVDCVLRHLEQKSILVTYRDRLRIHDRLRLEARACECHVRIQSDAMRWRQSGIAA